MKKIPPTAEEIRDGLRVGARGWDFVLALLQFVNDRRDDGQLKLNKETEADFGEIVAAVLRDGSRYLLGDGSRYLQ